MKKCVWEREGWTERDSRTDRRTETERETEGKRKKEKVAWLVLGTLRLELNVTSLAAGSSDRPGGTGGRQAWQ